MVEIVSNNKRKIYISAYFKGNVGDDLFVRTLVKNYPNEIFEIYIEKEFANSFVDLKNIHIIYKNIFNRILRFIRNKVSSNVFLGYPTHYKAIIEIGGSIFQQIEKNCELSKERKINMRLSKHYFIIGSNFGPYRNKKYYEAYTEFFSKIEGVVFRDKQSYELFKKLKNVSYAPDVVFNYPLNKKNIKTNSVSIVPVNLKYDRRSNFKSLDKYNSAYVGWLVNLIEYSLKKKLKVNLISFCNEEKDNEVISLILSKLKHSSIKHISVYDNDNIEKKIGIIASSKYLVSSRFHSMIIGWKCQINQIVVPYSDKTINVIKDLYPKQMSIKLTNLNSKEYEQIFRLANTMPISKLRKYELAAKKQFIYVDKLIN